MGSHDKAKRRLALIVKIGGIVIDAIAVLGLIAMMRVVFTTLHQGLK